MQMDINNVHRLRKDVITLASGAEAQVVFIPVERFHVESLNLAPPAEAVDMIAAGLSSARLETTTYPVPHPAVRSAQPQSLPGFGAAEIEVWAERVAIISHGYRGVRVTTTELWHDRRGPVPGKLPVPLAHVDLLRLRSATLARNQILANANHFLFDPREFDTPFEAYGDPIGMVVAKGVILHPPQVPRACLVSDSGRCMITNNAFEDVVLVLPGGMEIPAHGAGAFDDVPRPVAIARYFGSMDGLTPASEVAVEIAVVGRHAVAIARGGQLPIPRTGCVIRFPGEPDQTLLDALHRGEPVTYRLLKGHIEEGVQSGPRLVTGGRIETDKAAFLKEGVFVEGVEGDLSQPSPYDWHADLHETRAARLGAGIDAEGHLFLIAVEGKSSYVEGAGAAIGATLHDIAELLLRFGAVEGLHLDGGGSTQLFQPFGGSLLRPGDFCKGFNDAVADYDRPLPLGLKLELRVTEVEE
ncbi:phosphodiester glycosidase family protein [Agrobacterium sp. rho-13.3]|uniref:phosphodiester glycosidase family protein n=1 Tax=Agrobacterium sp. rho-13.3 TaxID=3072980 RepID=UPI002A0B90E1|nr:phosphodiester glycosidase family protein [Agrobacterium sp. rho-13.3]MDX8308124.1 phosphodiester glycosidase family protein [Agrobacterium sp. rho-13.3]